MEIKLEDLETSDFLSLLPRNEWFFLPDSETQTLTDGHGNYWTSPAPMQD